MLGYSLIRKETALKTLNFSQAGVHDFEFDGLTPVFVLGLGIQNTSNQSFTLNSIAGNVYANGYYVGNVAHFTPQTIKSNWQGILLLDARMSLLGIVNDLIKAYQNRNFTQKINLKATANIDRLQVSINEDYVIGL